MNDDVSRATHDRFDRMQHDFESRFGDLSSWLVGETLFAQNDSLFEKGRGELAPQVLARLILAGSTRPDNGARVLVAWMRYVRASVLSGVGDLREATSELMHLVAMGDAAEAVIESVIRQYDFDPSPSRERLDGLAAAMSVLVRIRIHRDGADAPSVAEAYEALENRFAGEDLESLWEEKRNEYFRRLDLRDAGSGS